MFREHKGNMDIHTTHNLSRRMNVRKYEKIMSHFNDFSISTKIEMSQNNIKGVQ